MSRSRASGPRSTGATVARARLARAPPVRATEVSPLAATICSRLTIAAPPRLAPTDVCASATYLRVTTTAWTSLARPCSILTERSLIRGFWSLKAASMAAFTRCVSRASMTISRKDRPSGAASTRVATINAGTSQAAPVRWAGPNP